MPSNTAGLAGKAFWFSKAAPEWVTSTFYYEDYPQWVTTLNQTKAIGADRVTGYLSGSFSSTDYVGHRFGPSSLESEDNLLRLDRTLAALFA